LEKTSRLHAGNQAHVKKSGKISLTRISLDIQKGWNFFTCRNAASTIGH
jgi:hypothetical protein